MTPVYLDSAATTRLDPLVLQEMLPWMTTEHGNTMSQSHAFGWRAERKVEECRDKIRLLLKAEEFEVVFTSGATESNNHFLFHFFSPQAERVSLLNENPSKNSGSFIKPRLALTPLEHASVWTTAENFAGWGWLDAHLGHVARNGTADIHSLVAGGPLQAACLMAVQNELGTVQPYRELVEQLKSMSVPVLIDATQAIGKIPFTPPPGPVFISFSAHKFNGPKGIGASLIHRSLLKGLRPLLGGGGHEKGYRSSTLNVPGIVGLTKALELAIEGMDQNFEKAKNQMSQLLNGMMDLCSEIQINTPSNAIDASPYICSVTLPAHFGDPLIPGLAISKGSACSQGGLSRPLKACGFSEFEGLRTLRISLDRLTPDSDIEAAQLRLRDFLLKNKSMSPQTPHRS